MTDDRRESLVRLATFFAESFDAATRSHGLHSIEARAVTSALQDASNTLHSCAPVEWRVLLEKTFYEKSTMQRALRRVAPEIADDAWTEGLGDA
jgi:hypothetical protein